MKKTFNINLGGIVFHIDEDAYELLDKYLSNLRIHFSKEEGGEEIVHDMELRISELFSERLNERNQVITLNDVEEIIAQMGKPEEFSEETTQDTSSYSESKEKGVKRLFRDPDNKVLGGVCSGIAAYFGWDVIILRIIHLFKSICYGLPDVFHIHFHAFHRELLGSCLCFGNDDPSYDIEKNNALDNEISISKDRECQEDEYDTQYNSIPSEIGCNPRAYST